MKNKLGIYLTILLSIGSAVYFTANNSSRYIYHALEYEISSSVERDINRIAYSTVISLVLGYLMFSAIHILLNKFIKPLKKSFSISIFIGIFTALVFSVILNYAMDLSGSFLQLSMALFLFGGITGLFAISLKMDESYIDSK